MFDLETQGHTHFSYDLAYLGIMLAIASILVPILALSKTWISENPFSIT